MRLMREYGGEDTGAVTVLCEVVIGRRNRFAVAAHDQPAVPYPRQIEPQRTSHDLLFRRAEPGIVRTDEEALERLEIFRS